MCARPGILHVQSDPGLKVPLDEFHDWYNNEHGPDRVRLSGINSGLRYEATDGLSPRWLATYELDDIAFLQRPVYSQLRENRSLRERRIVSWMAVLDRRIYRLIATQGQFKPELHSVSVTVGLTVQADASSELENWYTKVEHMAMLSCIPGWLRSRLLLSVSSGVPHYLAIHEYTVSNGLGGEEHKAAMSTPWRTRVMSSLVESGPHRRVYRLHRVLSKLPNDLEHLPSECLRVIDSFYLREDGVKLHYRLEGSPTGRVIAMTNSVQTGFHFWDPIIPHLSPNYMILRYDSRGRSLSTSGSTEPDLSSDLLSLLLALNISRIHALIGVSSEGVAVLHFTFHDSSLLSRVVAADCGISSSLRNTTAWEDCIALTRSLDVGRAEVACQILARWFLPMSLSERQRNEGAQAVEQMIISNPSGVEGGAHAPCDWDLPNQLPGLQVPSAFVAGDQGGVLSTAMLDLPSITPDTQFAITAGFGHLPMGENVDALWKAIVSFLQ